jgi:hypothetical protein
MRVAIYKSIKPRTGNRGTGRRSDWGTRKPGTENPESVKPVNSYRAFCFRGWMNLNLNLLTFVTKITILATGGETG